VRFAVVPPARPRRHGHKRNRCATDRDQTVPIGRKRLDWVRLRTFAPARMRTRDARATAGLPAHS